MTDAAFAYHEDVATRSNVKKSAAHKKNGSAVSKLGNKPMSWQEINKRHGECQEFDLGSFMDYETFKKMDPDLEAEYVNKLCEKYNVRISHISTMLFELGEDDLMSRLKIKGVWKNCKQPKLTEMKYSEAMKFKEEIESWRKKSEDVKIVDLSETQRKRNIIENAFFISRDEFETFSTDEQVSYINSVINRYGVSLAAIERELFMYKCTVLRGRLESAGVLAQIKRGKPGFATKKANGAFVEAIKEWKGEAAMEETVKETVPEESKEPVEAVELTEPAATKLHKNNISSISISVTDDTKKADTFDVIESPVTENEFHGSTVYSSTYRSKGVNSNELEGLKLLFADKMVEVSICVRVI